MQSLKKIMDKMEKNDIQTQQEKAASLQSTADEIFMLQAHNYSLSAILDARWQFIAESYGFTPDESRQVRSMIARRMQKAVVGAKAEVKARIRALMTEDEDTAA